MYYDSKKQEWIAEAIINSRKYSTETAEFICGKHHPIHPDDWGSIYKKKTGEFFFVESFGSGYYPNCWKNSWDKSKRLDMFDRRKQQIMPLTIEEAKMAIEEWGSTSDYEKLFGEVEE